MQILHLALKVHEQSTIHSAMRGYHSTGGVQWPLLLHPQLLSQLKETSQMHEPLQRGAELAATACSLPDLQVCHVHQ